MAATWTRSANRPRSTTSVQALTEAAPTLESEGVVLCGVGAIVLVVKAPDGQTITSGAVRGYLWIPSLGRWARAPRADDDLADLAGLNEGALSAIPVAAPDGRFAAVADGVVLSGGAAITIEFACYPSISRWEAL